MVWNIPNFRFGVYEIVLNDIVVCLGFLLSLIGWVTFAGVIVIILLMPIQAVVARISARLRRTMLSFTDKRIKAINEILQVNNFFFFLTQIKGNANSQILYMGRKLLSTSKQNSNLRTQATPQNFIRQCNYWNNHECFTSYSECGNFCCLCSDSRK